MFFRSVAILILLAQTSTASSIELVSNKSLSRVPAQESFIDEEVFEMSFDGGFTFDQCEDLEAYHEDQLKKLEPASSVFSIMTLKKLLNEEKLIKKLCQL
jgi:hypothetical protein